MPFVFWSVVSELQRSRSGGRTTRPGGRIDEERLTDAPRRVMPRYEVVGDG
jgi:hypothetical protein